MSWLLLTLILSMHGSTMKHTHIYIYIYIYIYVCENFTTVKVKLILEEAMNAHRGSRGLALLFL